MDFKEFKNQMEQDLKDAGMCPSFCDHFYRLKLECDGKLAV